MIFLDRLSPGQRPMVGIQSLYKHAFNTSAMTAVIKTDLKIALIKFIFKKQRGSEFSLAKVTRC